MRNSPALSIRYALAVLLALGLPGAADTPAEELTLAVDVPSDLGGTTYLSNQTVRRSQGSYSLRFDGPAQGLTPDVSINALLVEEDGSFLFSTDTPFTIGSFTYDPRDIVRWDAGSYSIHVDGGALGLAASADVDALARIAGGDLVVSFAEPELVLGATYQAGDIVQIAFGDLTLHTAAAALGLPPFTNVVGLEQDDEGSWYLLFEQPTAIGATTYLAGQVVRHDGNAFSLFFEDPAFPPGNAATGLALPGNPGDVDGLTLNKNGPLLLDLAWNPSCSNEASDYSIQEGTLGSWYSHTPIECSTGGLPFHSIRPEEGDRYFLVVPVNGMYEGSYGRDSEQAERPLGLTVCSAVQQLGACP